MPRRTRSKIKNYKKIDYSDIEEAEFEEKEEEEEDFEEEEYEVEEDLKEERINELTKIVMDFNQTLPMKKKVVIEEIDFILSSIYRKHFYKEEKNQEKLIKNYKTLFEKSNDFTSHKFIIGCLVEKIKKLLDEIRDKIINNDQYKSLKKSFIDTFKSKQNKIKDEKKRAFCIEYKKEITQIFKDLSEVYKAIIKASEDIKLLFNHSFEIILSEKKVLGINKV